MQLKLNVRTVVFSMLKQFHPNVKREENTKPLEAKQRKQRKDSS